MSQDENKKIKKEEEEGKAVEETVEETEETTEENEGIENLEEQSDTPEVDQALDSEDGGEVIEESISEEIEGVEEVKKGEERMPEFRVGDTIRVSYKIIEGDKVRTQPYQGIVIAEKGAGTSRTFTVRKIGADGIGVERIFPFFSPNIEKVKVMKMGKVRRAKLYYLRGRIGRKATKIKDRVSK
jgi:large subunit ribosomal protein L19